MNPVAGWYQSRTRVPDDRGQLVEVRDRNRKPREQPFRFLVPDWKQRTGWGRTWHVLKCIGMAAGIAWMGVVAVALAIILLKTMMTPSAYRMVAVMVGYGAILCVVFGSIAWMFSLLLGIDRRRNLQIVGARLAVAQCGRCNFNIADIPRAADGCIVCPECAAAWRLDLWLRDWSKRGDEGRNLLKSAIPFDWMRVNLLANRPATDRRKRLWRRWLIRFFLPSWVDVTLIAVTASMIQLSGLPLDLLLNQLSTDRPAWPAMAAFVLGLRALWAAHAAARSEIGRCVKAGTCPHCEMPLRTEPSHGDGATLCQSCGLAWREDRRVPLWKVAA